MEQEKDRDVENFISEANEVDIMTGTKGWDIMRRDIAEYMRNSNRLWMTMDQSSPQFEELRIRTLACHMLMSMVQDYKTNRVKMMDFYLKVKLPEYFIPFDVDNETPLTED